MSVTALENENCQRAGLEFREALKRNRHQAQPFGFLPHVSKAKSCKQRDARDERNPKLRRCDGEVEEVKPGGATLRQEENHFRRKHGSGQFSAWSAVEDCLCSLSTGEVCGT